MKWVILGLLLVGCAADAEERTGRRLVCGSEPLCVDYAEPKPVTNLSPKRAIRLHLDMRGVPDELRLPYSDAGEVLVHNWRGTLAAGYVNGIRIWFPPVQGLPVITIQLVEALPLFAPSGQSVVVQIKYQARLVDSAGNVLKRVDGVVLPKKGGNNLTQVVASAVENLYEKIAVDLLAQL
jgi:hypothetical protein